MGISLERSKNWTEFSLGYRGVFDFKPIVDALLKSAPTAVYVALVGVLWQIVYAIVKDRLARKEALEKLKLETEKFAFQSKADG